MTPQERDLLLPLLDKLRHTALPEKDPEAAQYIHQLQQEQPDTAYILTQTVLMQDYALHQAQARIEELERQSQSSQAQGSGSFLGGLFGNKQPANQSRPQQGGPWGQSAPQSPYAQPMAAAAQTGQPSFLRSAAQTAAGIAGGALLFQGIESLFGGRASGFGYGGGMMGGGMSGGNTEIVNNYYDTPANDSVVSDDQVGVQGDAGGDYSDASFDSSGADFSSDDDSFGI